MPEAKKAKESKDKTPPRRKKASRRREHAAHHGGAWKVAYADFVTAMMALFLVLWLVTQNNKIKESVAHYFRNMGVSKSGRDVSVLQGGSGIMKDQAVGTGGKNSGDKGLSNLKVSLRDRFEQKKEFEKVRDQINIEMVSEGLRIQIIDKADQVMFDVGSAQLKPATVAVLKAIADDLKQLSNTVVIEGYTDSHQYENPQHYGNWELSTERALNARRVLNDNGVRESQIVRVTGHADKALFNTKDPYDITNRRISITVLFQQEPDPNAAKGPAKS